MQTQVYDLSPLFRSTVGFDRISQMIDAAFKADERGAVSYPPYNIIKKSDDEYEYEIVMAVAGFKLEDLNVIVKENSLTITGSHTDKEEEQTTQYLHKGIATRSFERKFSLADHVQVQGAELDHGLLKLALKREVPEESKPRMVPIAGGSAKTIESKKVK